MDGIAQSPLITASHAESAQRGTEGEGPGALRAVRVTGKAREPPPAPLLCSPPFRGRRFPAPQTGTERLPSRGRRQPRAAVRSVRTKASAPRKSPAVMSVQGVPGRGRCARTQVPRFGSPGSLIVSRGADGCAGTYSRLSVGLLPAAGSLPGTGRTGGSHARLRGHPPTSCPPWQLRSFRSRTETRVPTAGAQTGVKSLNFFCYSGWWAER